MNHPINTWIIISTLFLFLYCNIADEDRCPAGFSRDSETGLCLEDVPDAGTDGDTDSDTDTDSDADADSDTDDDAGTGVVTGLGEPCEDDDDCAEYGANTCAENPLPPNNKNCTKLDCVAEECGDDYDCCDCTSVPEIGALVCLTLADAQLAAVVGCTCN